MKTQLLIPAAGMGTRLGAGGPKALVDLAGRPMLVRTLEQLAPLGLTAQAVILAPAGHVADFEAVLASHFAADAPTVIEGGAERQESVARGLDRLDPDTDIVAIHDAARPFVHPDTVQAAIDAAARYGAATVAIPSADTILVADPEDFLIETPDRSRLWACQTPQVFQVAVLREAHAQARESGYLGTDDATLACRTGHRVKLVPGTALNFKITTPADLALACCVVEKGLASCA